MLRFNQARILLNKELYKSFRCIQHLVQKHISDPSYYELINFQNLSSIRENIERRKSSADISKIQRLLDTLDSGQIDETRKHLLLQELKNEIRKMPNDTHPDVCKIGESPKLIQKFCNEPQFNFEPKSFAELTKKLNILRMEHLGNFTGHKSYYFLSTLAEMEQALIRFTLDELRGQGFSLITVPDVLPGSTIEGCGMEINGERTQVYKLSDSDFCLSGTSEMALAGYYANKTLNVEDLPIKVTATSRCFRAETSGLQEEKGIYRVHQFTKAEMFSICTEQQSSAILELFKEIEIKLYRKLGLHFQLLDMPPNELGAPAYRKYDIEAWMPGRNMWGEISSCSNCTDYQAKRLNIKYQTRENTISYVHTVNGTACAVPRMLIALLETYQNEDGTIQIPDALKGYMRGKTEIGREKKLPELKLMKNIKSP